MNCEAPQLVLHAAGGRARRRHRDVRLPAAGAERHDRDHALGIGGDRTHHDQQLPADDQGAGRPADLRSTSQADRFTCTGCGWCQVNTDIVTQEFCRDGANCVRAVTVDGEPWLVVSDVCAALSIGNVSQAVKRLEPDDLITTEVIDSLGRWQRAWVVNESGVFDLILDSRKPEAKAFRRWVTAEVLPAIRRTGSYSVGGPALPSLPQTYAEALRELAATVERAEAAEAARSALAPRAEAWDDLASSGADYSAREAAAILSRAGIQTGQNRLLRSLRDLGMVDGSGRPYARHAHRLRLKPVTFEHPYTGVRMPGKPQIRITVEGLAHLRRRLGGRRPLEIEAKS